MIYTVSRGVATEVNVSLINSSDASVNGVAVGAVTVETRKTGGSFVTKSLLAGEWNEVGDGIYKLSLNATDTDTAGFLRVKVSGASWETYRLDVAIVDDYVSVAEQLIDIKEALALKTNIDDADTLFSQLELRMREAEDTIDDLEKRLGDALAALNASR